MAREKWKRVVGWPGYEVSDRGPVISFKWVPPLVIKPQVWRGRGGRGKPLAAVVTLTSGRRIRRTFKVHRLVLEAFRGPRPAGMQCRHLDSNPLNNELKNLVWGTFAENWADR